MDFDKIINDLKTQIEKAAEEAKLEERLKQGKEMGADALAKTKEATGEALAKTKEVGGDALDKGKELGGEALDRVRTDPNAQIAAVGAGGLLAAALLGTKGGRKFLGGTAKIGAVAGLGALAYHAWRTRQGEEIGNETAGDIEAAGFVIDGKMETGFAEALVRTMVGAAWADGVLDKEERGLISEALEKAGSDGETLELVLGKRPEKETLDFVAGAAKSPNHAAQLYAAACLVTGDPNQKEEGFLKRLADRLKIEDGHASAIQAEVMAG